MALPGPAPPLLLLLLLPLTAAAAAATPSAQLPAVAPCNFTEGVDCGGMITPPGFMRNYGTDARPVAIPRRRDRPLQRALLATKGTPGSLYRRRGSTFLKEQPVSPGTGKGPKVRPQNDARRPRRRRSAAPPAPSRPPVPPPCSRWTRAGSACSSRTAHAALRARARGSVACRRASPCLQSAPHRGRRQHRRPARPRSSRSGRRRST